MTGYTGRNIIDDVNICHRAMELRDHGVSLVRIAQILKAEYPDKIETLPSKGGVTLWADRGVENWHKVVGEDYLLPRKVAGQAGRRLHSIMGELYDVRTNPKGRAEDLERLLKCIDGQVKLESALARALLPSRVQNEISAPAGVDPATAEKVRAALGPPPTVPPPSP